MGNGNVEKTTTSFGFDVGLGLRMQVQQPNTAETSYPCKRTPPLLMPHHHHPYYHHHHQQQQQLGLASGESTGGGHGGGGTSGGGPSFCSTSNQLACVSDIYDDSVLPRTIAAANNSALKSSGGGMAVSSGKALFTASQWQELERQTVIYKYIMASAPVPPELLFPITKAPSHHAPPHLPASSQSNTSGLDLRFSSGSDPEPWRCRRTDGKKWRCSRDVAPDQKYCERHAHKSRPRSRKHVEAQSHNITNTNSYTQPHHVYPASSTTNSTGGHQSLLQSAISHFPTMVPAATSYDQTRCIEWFMRGGSGTIPVSTSNQQWQQLTQSSSRAGFNKDSTDHNKNLSVFQQQYEEKDEPMSFNSYMDSATNGQRLENHQQLSEHCNNSIFDPKMASLQGSLNADRTQTTRHFIDAWSTAEKEGLNEMRNKGSVSSSSRDLPLSSLTLSMSGGNEVDEDNEHTNMGVGLMESERYNDGVIRSQWLNPVSWMSSTPGGPLGEALRLGNASTTKATTNLPSPHGYSNSTTTSSCSKSSC